MSDFKPLPCGATHAYDNAVNPALGWLVTEFECFELNPKYSWEKRLKPPPEASDWPIVVPKWGPPIGDLPTLIQKIMEVTWKFAEPSEFSAGGNLSIGLRGGAYTSSTDTYHPQVRPTQPVLKTVMGNKNAIASDWKLFEQIKRTNAVTFRGDSRPPAEVISTCHGFYPPNSRTDADYIKWNIYEAFRDYLKHRYNRALEQNDFLQAVTASAPTPDLQKLLVDYMMWRKICEKEAVHLGRMVDNECLKGYISTARSIDTAMKFGTRQNKVNGWLYVTLVHGGFEVPWGSENKWGTEEGEVAQWGPVPGDRIVGFVQIEPFTGPKPGSPIFMRRGFHEKEPEAFEFMFNAMSGMRPEQAHLI